MFAYQPLDTSSAPTGFAPSETSSLGGPPRMQTHRPQKRLIFQAFGLCMIWLCAASTAAASTLCRLPDYDPAKTPPKHAPNVLLIAVDTLRADHLQLYGHGRATSKNLDALAADSWIFEKAISPAPWTTPSFAGILTGRHPGALGISDKPTPLPSEVSTLAESLQDMGYATAGLVSHYYVGEKFGFHRGFDAWDQRYAGGHNRVSSEGIQRMAKACFSNFARAKRPFFLFTHFFDPHYDYLEHRGFKFGEPYNGEITSRGNNFERLRAIAKAGRLTPDDRRHLTDRYDSEIAYTDSHIGLLLDELKKRGLYEDTLIVFLSDHGEMFGERNARWIGHTRYLFDELVRVPLMIKLPKAKTPSQARPRMRGRVSGTVSLVNVFPTVMDVVSPHIRWKERSLIPDSQGRVQDEPVFTQTRRWRHVDAVYDGPWKLTVDQSSGRQLLYNLEKDPGEKNNVARDHPEQASKMGKALGSWLKELQSFASRWAPTAEPVLTDEEIEALRSLGYIQ